MSTFPVTQGQTTGRRMAMMACMDMVAATQQIYLHEGKVTITLPETVWHEAKEGFMENMRTFAQILNHEAREQARRGEFVVDGVVFMRERNTRPVEDALAEALRDLTVMLKASGCKDRLIEQADAALAKYEGKE